MLDLKTQLSDYLDHVVQRLEVEDILEERVGSGPVQPVQPRFVRRSISRWVYGVAAAVVLLLLVGGVGWLAQQGEDDVVDQSTTTIIDETPLSSGGLLGPGGWSVAATFPEPGVDPDVMASTAEIVRGWPGVLDVATAADDAAWRRLTGFDAAACAADSSEPPCSPGVVLLVMEGQAEPLARRLQSELSMRTIAAHQEPWDFVAGYLAAAIDLASPAPLRFDPATLGREVVLRGPFVDIGADEGCPVSRCEVAVDVEVDGMAARLSLALLSPDRLEEEAGFGSPNVILGTGDPAGFGAVALNEVSDLLPGTRGSTGVVGRFGFPLDSRRSFPVAGLPLEVAVVTVELADGSSVWQRPLAGMAWLMDEPGSFSPEDETTTTRMTGFDSDGRVILLIDGGDDPELTITDLRADSDLQTQPAAAPGFAATVEAGDLTVTWTEASWSEDEGPHLQTLVGTPSGILGTNAGRVLRWTNGTHWESVSELSDVDVDSMVDGREFVLVSGTRPRDELVLMRSTDGQTWTDIDRSSLERVGTEIRATSPSGLTVIGNESQVVAKIDGDRVTDVHDSPWDECCQPSALLEFDGAVVALARDFNSSAPSSAWRYLGDGEWALPENVPIGSTIVVVEDTALAFDHTSFPLGGCCADPVGAKSQSTLLTSTNGTQWTTHATLESVTTSGLQIEAGDFFWVYGLHGAGGSSIERFGEFATLWISRDARVWEPLDISFTQLHSIVSVAGDTIFIWGAGAGTDNVHYWIGTISEQ